MAMALPGFGSPAASFEQPYEMLAACHERVLRSLDLMGRLLDHIEKNGHNTQTQSAAADVLRYFDLAAPLHHQDEELHVFPLLLAQGDATQRSTVLRLQAEHRQMEELWATVRAPLLRWRAPGCTEAVSAEALTAATGFIKLYASHIDAEETLVFPPTQAQMNAAQLEQMGREMQARRQS
jgi:hemerythrin-like domain-containing protein